MLPHDPDVHMLLARERVQQLRRDAVRFPRPAKRPARPQIVVVRAPQPACRPQSTV